MVKAAPFACGDSGTLVLNTWNAEWECEKGGARRFNGGCPAWRQRETGVPRQNLLPRADHTKIIQTHLTAPPIKHTVPPLTHAHSMCSAHTRHVHATYMHTPRAAHTQRPYASLQNSTAFLRLVGAAKAPPGGAVGPRALVCISPLHQKKPAPTPNSSH
jgi:hypothetical protein